VRRLIQVFALLLVILAGSLPGLRLLGTATGGCCASVPGQPCPCRMPARSPGPDVPCGLAATAPAAILAAPCRQAQTRPARREPSPCPPSLLAVSRPALACPAPLARPGPALPPGPAPDRQTLLSVFRI
jgi:hypothetical protein